jgi:hypothetical protein
MAPVSFPERAHFGARPGETAMPKADGSPRIQYVDVPSIPETYADSVNRMMFDGQSVRLEFCVTRMDEPRNGSTELTGTRQTACRVVLPLGAALELSGKLSRMLTALAKRGAETRSKQAQAKAAPPEARPN